MKIINYRKNESYIENELDPLLCKMRTTKQKQLLTLLFRRKHSSPILKEMYWPQLLAKLFLDFMEGFLKRLQK